MAHLAGLVEYWEDDVLDDGVVASGVVVGGIFLAVDDGLRMVEAVVLAGADGVAHGGFEVDHDGTGMCNPLFIANADTFSQGNKSGRESHVGVITESNLFGVGTSRNIDCINSLVLLTGKVGQSYDAKSAGQWSPR